MKTTWEPAKDPMADSSNSMREQKGFKGAKEIDSLRKLIPDKKPLTEYEPFREFFTPREKP